jgi:hypothetical protein
LQIVAEKGDVVTVTGRVDTNPEAKSARSGSGSRHRTLLDARNNQETGNDASKKREGPPRNFDATTLVIRRSASQKSDFAPQDVPTVSGQRSEGAIST